MFRQYQRDRADAIASVEVENGNDALRGADYQASSDLENAINVAVTLARPLLVSGEPGCGKTELGFSIARKLGIPRVHYFAVKSDSEARRLFYSYDAMARFHAAQIGRADAHEDREMSGRARDFIEYQALGRAILDAHAAADVAHLAAGRYRHPDAPQRSVVIIDEIDKAPRDFPNDLLAEIDQLWFRVPELGAGSSREPESPPKERIPNELRPVVVITSNSEKQLPDAFLRRCIFHHIVFPDEATLKKIVDKKLAALGLTPPPTVVDEAVDLVTRARRERLEKLPGTAELLDFVRALSSHATDGVEQALHVRFTACLNALSKTEHDTDTLLKLLPTGA
jgi:MoxR-like ATPase